MPPSVGAVSPPPTRTTPAPGDARPPSRGSASQPSRDVNPIAVVDFWRPMPVEGASDREVATGASKRVNSEPRDTRADDANAMVTRVKSEVARDPAAALAGAAQGLQATAARHLV